MRMSAHLAVGLLLGSMASVSAAECGCGAPHADGQCVRVHVHYVPVKQHCHHFCGPAPPAGPVFESAAIRRVPIAGQQTEFRFRQEAGELPSRPESGALERSCCAPNEDTIKRFEDIDRRLETLDFQVNKIFDFVTKQQEIMQKLEQRLGQ